MNTYKIELYRCNVNAYKIEISCTATSFVGGAALIDYRGVAFRRKGDPNELTLDPPLMVI